jgi:hypothetical protein
MWPPEWRSENPKRVALGEIVNGLIWRFPQTLEGFRR